MGFYDICVVLLYHGELTNINSRTSLQRTPLHLACIKGHSTIVEFFIREQADLNCTDIELNTPLHYAAQYGHLVIVKMLIRKKVYYLRNGKGCFPVDVCRSKEIYEALLNDLPQLESCGYGRAVYNNVVLSNSREDMISKLLHKYTKPPSAKDTDNL